MPVLPFVATCAAGAVAAVVVVRLLKREWQRVNGELDRARPARVTDPERARLPQLRRDPSTGVYRPDR